MSEETLPRKIRDFWFGRAIADPSAIGGRMGFWFGTDAARDSAMKAEWLQVTEDAIAGRLDKMGSTPPGRLALILLLDQFSRNLFRGSPRAFDKDGRARYLMRDGMSRQMDLALSPIERCFFYMPLQHSEFLEDQESSVSRFEQLLSEVSLERREVFRSFLDYAKLHRDIVARFGRFPHRNGTLNRLSTREELAYLAGNAPRFGQA
ncbi:MAG: DUF924 family protein [Gammaproteobacteria bacterium]|jgi:uncharacterized protein (DUF924 family)